MKKGMILSITSAICFGLVPLFTKIVLSMNYDVIAIGFFRFLGLGIFSACMIKIKKVPLKLDVSILPSIALDSFFQVLTLILLSTSYLFIPTGNATSLHFMYPIFVFLILYFYYKNHFSRVQWIALILSILGILFFIDFGNMNNGIGMLIAIVSGLTYAIYMVILDKQGLAALNPFVLAFYACIMEVIVLGIIGIASGSFSVTVNGLAIVSLIALSALSIGGTLLLQVGTRLIGSGMASLFCLFEPLTSLFCGWFLLKDPILVTNILGCILIFASIFLIMKPKKRRR